MVEQEFLKPPKIIIPTTDARWVFLHHRAVLLGEGPKVVRQQEKPVFVPLMSLSSAAAVVCKAATQREHPSEEAVNGMARMIAARTRVLTIADGDVEHAMLMPSEIFEGKFRERGACLVFADGRPPIRNLRILTSALAGLIADITALYKTG